MRAKAVNFGIPYGREAQSFKEEFGITIEEAQGMIDGWLNKYHGARDYLNWCADQVLAGNYLQTPWGNRRRAGLVTAESLHNLQNEFKNFPIQGSSSHLLLYSAIKLEKVLKEKYDTVICNLIHDSMYLEVPMDPATVKAVSQLASSTMVQAPVDLFNCHVPFKTDTDLGPDWGNVTEYNDKTETMHWEEVVDGAVVEKSLDYPTWIEQKYHWDIYNTTWYQDASAQSYQCVQI